MEISLHPSNVNTEDGFPVSRSQKHLMPEKKGRTFLQGQGHTLPVDLIILVGGPEGRSFLFLAPLSPDLASSPSRES